MPEAVVERILKVASKENDVVLDSFLGSGTTAKVCADMNRICIGIEMNPDYYNLALERIRKAKTQTQLSAESCPMDSLIAVSQN